MAQTKIIAFGNKRPNVLAKCVADYTLCGTLSSINKGQQIATLVVLPPHSISHFCQPTILPFKIFIYI
ncbi:MAG: hypothetical protein WCH21_10675 [Bacteroidota bacterium]